MVIDDVANTVKKYGYKISGKQAYVIANAAVRNKSKWLLNGNNELDFIFTPPSAPKPKPKTVRQLQKAAAVSHMPKKENIVSAMKRRGVDSSTAWRTLNAHYSDIAKNSAGGGTKDVLDLFMGKI